MAQRKLLDLRRVEDKVVDPSRGWVDPSVLDPIHNGLEGHVQVDHHVHRGLLLKGLCLGLSPKHTFVEMCQLHFNFVHQGSDQNSSD